MLAWGSSYYLPAIVAVPMAATFGCPPSWIFGAFSAGLLLMALLGPVAGRIIDRIGGRDVLGGSSLVFALALATLATAPNLVVLGIGWALLGTAMAAGLYDAAFAALAGLFGRGARAPITGITLLGGFASSVAWPLSTLMLEAWGWRGTCAAWAALHLVVGLPLYRLFIPPTPAPASGAALTEDAPAAPRRAMILLAVAFSGTAMVTGAIAAHLPRLLELAGAGTAAAIAAAALFGPAQVGARLTEFTFFRSLHPLVSGRIAGLMHPAGCLVLAALGPAGIAAFSVLYGIGNGMLTIVKGTLPLALFGPTGYGMRTGLLSAPARLSQAAAPLGFAWAIEAWGLQALWITAGLNLASVLALMALRR